MLPYDPSRIVELQPPSGRPPADAVATSEPAADTVRTMTAPWLPVWVGDSGQWHLARLLAWHQPADGNEWTVTVRASLDDSAPLRHLRYDSAVIKPVRNQPPHQTPGSP